MSDHARVSHPLFSLLPAEVEGFEPLAELALDMRSSWNHATDQVWRQLDPVLWELTHNPWGVLQTVSRDRIERVSADPVFRKSVDGLVRARRQVAEAPAWFQQTYPQSLLSCVAYFSMEFMLSEALPIYSGGLGNVAGDQLKAASDLGVPVVGVGLLYQQGYFRQVIDKDGAQQALYPYNDPGQLPVTPLRQENGEWLRLEIALPGYSVWLRAWQVQVGRVKLYLLDSNDPANIPAHRGITSELYGGGPELRLKQELLLGIGGWRLLAALGIQPEVCHLNEGHAAFAVLERARGFMQESAQPFEVALAVTRAGNLFTTHTAVAAGFDRFAPALIEQYLGGYAEQKLDMTLHDLLALGRSNPNDSSEPFNMAYLAIRGSGAVNGVSRLHGKVSRHLFEPLFAHWPQEEIPVGHVTNGIHVPTWDSAPADDLWTQACGKDRWLGTTDTLEQDIRRVSDAGLWQFRTAASKSLVEYARERLSRQLAASGASPEAVDEREAPVRSQHADPGLCAPLRDLQAAEPAAARPGAAAAPVDQSAAPGATHHGGQGSSGGPGRPGPDPGMDAFHPAARGAPPCDLPQRLRHAPDRAPGAGRGRLAQHAAAPLGSLRNQRHEGARQRRHQSLGAGRLVGGSLRAGGRLGAGGRPGTRRRSRPGTLSKPRRSMTCSSAR